MHCDGPKPRKVVGSIVRFGRPRNRSNSTNSQDLPSAVHPQRAFCPQQTTSRNQSHRSPAIGLSFEVMMELAASIANKRDKQASSPVSNRRTAKARCETHLISQCSEMTKQGRLALKTICDWTRSVGDVMSPWARHHGCKGISHLAKTKKAYNCTQTKHTQNQHGGTGNHVGRVKQQRKTSKARVVNANVPICARNGNSPPNARAAKDNKLAVATKLQLRPEHVRLLHIQRCRECSHHPKASHGWPLCQPPCRAKPT